MSLERIKRAFTIKTASAALAVMMVAGLFAAFAGGASAAHGDAKMTAKGGCIGTLMAGNHLDTALSELVKEGTLTQAQADAVKAKVGADASKGEKACAGLALLKASGVGNAVETLLGLSAKEIRADYGAGKSLTEIAQTKGVDRAKLVSTIETAINAELDQLVTDGKISAAQAATVKTNVADRVEKAVDAHKSDRKAGGATPVATPTV